MILHLVSFHKMYYFFIENSFLKELVSSTVLILIKFRRKLIRQENQDLFLYFLVSSNYHIHTGQNLAGFC